MPRSQKACRECGHQAADGWYISKTGKCRPCSVARAVALIDAMFPPDPPCEGRGDLCQCSWCRETGAVIPAVLHHAAG